MQRRGVLVGVGGAGPLACLGGGVADADPAGKIVRSGGFGGVKCGQGSFGLCVGVGERGELTKESGLDGIESCGLAIGFSRRMPIALKGVGLSKIDVGGDVFRIEPEGVLEVGNCRVVISFLGEVQAGVEMTEDVIGIDLEGTADVAERAIKIAAIVVGAGELALNDVSVGRIEFGGGEQRVVVVKDGDAALGLNEIESKESDEGGGECDARGRRGETGEQGQASGGGENGETYGRNVEIALGEEVDGEGVEAESRGQSEDKPAEGKRENRARGAKIKSGYCQEDGTDKSRDGPAAQSDGDRKGVEIVHVDGDEEFADVAGKDGRNREEEIERRVVGALGARAWGEATQRGDAGEKVDDECDEIGSETGGQREYVGTGGAGIEKFVAEENDGKEQRRLLAEKSGQKEKSPEEKRR